MERLTDHNGVLQKCLGKNCDKYIIKDGDCYCPCTCPVSEDAYKKLADYEYIEENTKSDDSYIESLKNDIRKLEKLIIVKQLEDYGIN
jgi:hypothetical protein